MALQWNDMYSVKNATIDHQHQHLFEIVNALEAAVKQGKTKEALGESIAELIGYTQEHFSTEEKYFAKYGYPEATEHKAEHDKFVNKVSDFKRRFDDGTMAMSVEVRLFLSDWLVNHIMKTDQKYSDFLLKAGA